MQINTARAARRRITSQIFTVACLVATAIALVALCLILWSLFTQGFGASEDGGVVAAVRSAAPIRSRSSSPSGAGGGRTAASRQSRTTKG